MKKLNSKGFVHHLALLLVVVGIAIGGSYYLISSKADSYGNPLSSKSVCQGTHYKRVWKNGACSKTCQSGYVSVSSTPYDYCKKAGTSSASPASSKAVCEGANYNRIWKNGACSKDCKSNYLHVTADPYDYCKAVKISDNTGGYSCTITASPKPAPGKATKYTIKVKINGVKNSYNYIGFSLWGIYNNNKKLHGLFGTTTGNTGIKLGLVKQDGLTHTFTVTKTTPKSAAGHTFTGIQADLDYNIKSNGDFKFSNGDFDTSYLRKQEWKF